MKKISYSYRFNKDYEFYLELSKISITLPNSLNILNRFIYNCNWVSAKECFYMIDSWLCKTIECNDIDTIKKILIWKAYANFIVTQWIDWYCDWTIFPFEIKEECKLYPERMLNSFLKATQNDIINKKRYISMKQLFII